MEVTEDALPGLTAADAYRRRLPQQTLTTADGLPGRPPREAHKGGPVKVACGRVGGSERVAVQLGVDRDSSHLPGFWSGSEKAQVFLKSVAYLIDDLKTPHVDVYSCLLRQLPLRAHDSQPGGAGA